MNIWGYRKQKRMLARLCVLIALLVSMNVATVQAGSLEGIGNWISDRADDVSDVVSDAGEVITDSDATKFIGNKASEAGQFVGQYAGIAGEWIGSNAAAAGKMVGENASMAKVWVGENSEIAGSWIGENASAASDWLGVNASNACNWIVDNGTIVGAWIGETTSGAGVWIGENASEAGTMIGETASGAGIWVNEKVTDVSEWVEKNSLFSEDGIVVLGDNLAEFGIEKTEELEELAIGVKNYVENIDPSVYTTKEYYIQTGEKLLLGEYSDANMTGLAVGLNVVASIVNLDMAMDLRDLAHDIQYIGDGSVGIVELGIDAASCLPVIGVVKNVKYLDDVKDLAKAVDGIADVADGAKDASKVVDIVDDVKDLTKVADVADEVKDASKVADVVDDAKDLTKAADVADDVKDASKVEDVADNVKDASKAAEAADGTGDNIKDATKVADTADDIIKQCELKELPDTVQDMYKKYDEDGWKGLLPDAKEGTHAGGVFENRDHDLPLVDDLGNKVTYKEFDAYDFGTEPSYLNKRGRCRFVKGSDGKVYFTDDHYKTFKLIN